jgi:hypothetical protein
MNRAIGILVFVLILLGGEYPGFSADSVIELHERKDVQKVLKEIHDEVVALGKYPGDDFFKREVFVGKDDDDTNKDIHVAIVIHDTGEEEKMTIQVTYMMRSKGSPVVGIAKSVKSIKCSCQKNQFHIKHSGFGERELKPILKDILRAVRNKKKLLEKINF